MQNRPCSAAGFSLVELILVILVMAIALGVLAPRLGSLSDDAHSASLQQVAGAYATSVALVRAQWVAQGHSGPVNNLRGFGRNDVNVSPDGWPVSVNGGTDPGTVGQQDCLDLWHSLLQSNAPRLGAAEDEGVKYTVAMDSGRCLYRYQGNDQGHYFSYAPETGELVTFLH